MKLYELQEKVRCTKSGIACARCGTSYIGASSPVVVQHVEFCGKQNSPKAQQKGA